MGSSPISGALNIFLFLLTSARKSRYAINHREREREKPNKKGKKPNDKKYNVVEVVMSEAPINTL